MGMGCHFPSPEDLPDPEIEPASPALAGEFFYCWASREVCKYTQMPWEKGPFTIIFLAVSIQVWKIRGTSQECGKYFLSAMDWTLRRQRYPTPVLLPGKSHGRRSLVGCSPWGRKESDMTERLHFHFSLLCIEENGNALQCSCLENPRDGFAQSRTRLKWLSSNSSMYWTVFLQNSYVVVLNPSPSECNKIFK